MTDLSQLYKDVVLHHNRKPVNFGKPEEYTHYAQGLNALCGDQINVYLYIENDHCERVSFSGECCAIAMASASLMCEYLSGQTVGYLKHMFDAFCRLMDKHTSLTSIDCLGEINALVSVKKFPSRIKSATLAWHAMYAALHGENFATTE